MSSLRTLAKPAYLVAAILVLFPVLELVQAAWPVRLGEVTWRVLAAGLLSRVLLTPLLGLLVAYAAAVFLEQNRVIRLLTVVNVALAAMLLAGVSVYALDAIELRAQIADDTRQTYDLGVVISFAKYALALLVLLALAYSQWRVLRESAKKPKRASATSSALVFPSSGLAQGAEAPAPPPAPGL